MSQWFNSTFCAIFFEVSVAGVMVSIAAFQAVDPGSIPGPRMFFFSQNIEETFTYQTHGSKQKALCHMVRQVISDSTISTVMHRFSSEHRS